MKLLPILASFSKKDWHWLQKFVNSPIYNQHSAVIRLFEFFRKRPLDSEKQYSSDFLHKKLFPEAPFDTAKTHHTANYLLRSTEDFLAWDEWWQDEPERQRYLLQACRHRGLDRHFAETLQKLGHNIEQQPLRDADLYRFRYRLAFESYQHSIQSEGHSAAEHLQPFSDWHDLSFVAEKLKNACGIYSHKRLLHTELDLGLLPAVLEFVRARPALLEHTAVAVYFHGYHALSEPNEDAHFFALKNLLESAASKFTLSELRAVYLLAVNFCIHRINLRQENYLREIFDLYKNGLELSVFIENSQISRFTYTNIALTAFRLREFEWAHGFLLNYRDKLPETQRQGAFAFNLARYHCERGDYTQAMPLLLEMDFDDVLHNLTAKAMLAKMYWETSEINALENLLTSFSVYLRRKRQVSDQLRTGYQNFIRFVRRLQAMPPGKKAARAALREEIANTALVAEKDWLLRML
ncbi:MAG: hypothetical protein H7246_02715 [Phycisphaerae bacterium]|nr:hypothetical protein [Saprospiraceae bacterium]